MSVRKGCVILIVKIPFVHVNKSQNQPPVFPVLSTEKDVKKIPASAFSFTNRYSPYREKLVRKQWIQLDWPLVVHKLAFGICQT